MGLVKPAPVAANYYRSRGSTASQQQGVALDQGALRADNMRRLQELHQAGDWKGFYRLAQAMTHIKPNTPLVTKIKKKNTDGEFLAEGDNL